MIKLLSMSCDGDDGEVAVDVGVGNADMTEDSAIGEEAVISLNM